MSQRPDLAHDTPAPGGKALLYVNMAANEAAKYS